MHGIFRPSKTTKNDNVFKSTRIKIMNACDKKKHTETGNDEKKTDAHPEQIIPNSRNKLNENNKQFIFRLPSSIPCHSSPARMPSKLLYRTNCATTVKIANPVKYESLSVVFFFLSSLSLLFCLIPLCCY